ncbi:MAG: response regulator [Bacteroidales bacterium]|nr:response regulator [Bacteroidales bacterium]
MGTLKQILLIEDDVALAGTIKNYLTIKGFEVVHAENGALGIQQAFSKTPLAIICDINIPVVDGYQVFKILSESPATHAVPFIFLTAKTSPSEIRMGMQLGADDYLTKPFELNDLLSSLNTRIRKRDKLLQANEEKFMSLLNNHPHAVFICQNNHFIVVNRKLSNLTGYSQAELEETGLTHLADEADRDKLTLRMQQCVANHEKEFSMEFSLRDKWKKQIQVKLMGGFSYFKGRDCLVGTLINLSSGQYALSDIALSSNDLEELGKAIELFSSDYHIISKSLVEKLSHIFRKDEHSAELTSTEVELSAREKDVLREICTGKSTHEIAESLFISERTVEKHRAAIVQKTNSKNMIEAVIFAIRNRLVGV